MAKNEVQLQLGMSLPAFLERYDSGLFEPMAGRAMKEYVVVPPALVYDDAIADWVRRSRAFAEQLPAKKPKQKKG